MLLETVLQVDDTALVALHRSNSVRAKWSWVLAVSKMMGVVRSAGVLESCVRLETFCKRDAPLCWLLGRKIVPAAAFVTP